MREFLNFLRSTRLSLLLILFCILFVALGVVLLRSRLAWFELSADYLSFHRSQEKPELSVASPIESHYLDRYEELWPETFNSLNPFKSARIPAFYARIQHMQDPLINARDLEEARVWSVLMAAGHKEELKVRFPRPVLKDEASRDQDCSLKRQEYWFRKAQIWPELEVDFQKYHERCAPSSVQTLWFDLQRALLSENTDQINEAGLKFQVKMNDYPGKWSRWFALEAYQLAHVISVRLGEARGEANSIQAEEL